MALDPPHLAAVHDRWASGLANVGLAQVAPYDPVAVVVGTAGDARGHPAAYAVL